MTNDLTGPAHYRESNRLRREAHRFTYGDGNNPVAGNGLATEALVHAVNAQTAMVAQLIDAVTGGHPPYEMDAWREVIPLPPLKECKGKETRRPACAERHTEDCQFTDPPPEPKHELLDVGTRVLVSDLVWNEDTRVPERKNPQPGRISGHAGGGHKYRWQYEFEPGIYSDHDQFAFADNRVEVHPDGPECPSPPKPVKREPTGPRVYVQSKGGQQGYIVGTAMKSSGLRLRVHWLKPGGAETWYSMADATIIPEDQVQRCDNGADQENCVEIDLCESCEQDRDAEGDAIEESMGLR